MSLRSFAKRPNVLFRLIMPGLHLFTTRLELVAGTVELARAEIDDLPAFARLLDVPQPANWPPPLNDEHSQKSFLAALETAPPNETGWQLWFCLRKEPRALLGSAGFKGAPRNGLVEIGYSMLGEHQGNGYCTEAVQALTIWAFRHPDVQKVIAHTFPELAPSIRVMEKCGLVFAGNGPIEDGMQTICYELTSERFHSLRQ
ncbi:MAG TPA: GNAT family N-acetyltransferase [Candidatus Angelobacter sp.]|jgi:RimJ/RimL family protein N-acetyltransferase|nr:GNAT family N-acetyltransferase [Candidatus Angelobacter sp.]